MPAVLSVATDDGEQERGLSNAGASDFPSALLLSPHHDGTATLLFLYTLLVPSP